MNFNGIGEGREMQKLIKLMKSAMLLEYDRVRKKYGDTYNTPHEAYAVTLEEFEEARTEIELITAQMKGLWSLVKYDCDIADQMEVIKEHALLGAAECVQIAMCCHKTLQSECCKESEVE